MKIRWIDLKAADGQFDYKSDRHFSSQLPVAKSHLYLQRGKKETQSVLNSVSKASVVDSRPEFVTDVFLGSDNVSVVEKSAKNNYNDFSRSILGITSLKQ